MILHWESDLIRAVPPEDEFGCNELVGWIREKIGWKEGYQLETLKAQGSGDKDLTPENNDFIC